MWRRPSGVTIWELCWRGRWQVVAFIDSARLTVNKNPWAPGKESTTVSGTGAGLNWVGADRWSVKSYLAARLGPTSALVATSSAVRAWVELGKVF